MRIISYIILLYKIGEHMSEYVKTGKGRLKVNKVKNPLAPTHTGVVHLDAEYVQKLIDKGYGRIMLPFSAWLKDSQFDDTQYIDIQTSIKVTE